MLCVKNWPILSDKPISAEAKPDFSVSLCVLPRIGCLPGGWGVGWSFTFNDSIPE